MEGGGDAGRVQIRASAHMLHAMVILCYAEVN